jgi:hypothetical protein
VVCTPGHLLQRPGEAVGLDQGVVLEAAFRRVFTITANWSLDSE